jgi:hypothetical protein
MADNFQPQPQPPAAELVRIVAPANAVDEEAAAQQLQAAVARLTRMVTWRPVVARPLPSIDRARLAAALGSRPQPKGGTPCPSCGCTMHLVPIARG